MVYQIDQSGKVEDTNKLTIVCVAGRKVKTLKISAREKRRLIMTMRMIDYPKKIFIYKTFAALVFLLIKEERITNLLIDKEYPGHEPFIKEIILQFFKNIKRKPPIIHFCLVGKDSPAHKIAIETFRGKRKPHIVIRAENVISLFYMRRP